MPKEINPKLTDQQKKVMFEEATESPGSSELNFEKEKGPIIVLIVILNFLNQIQNTKVDQVGHLFMKHYQMLLKQKQII